MKKIAIAGSALVDKIYDIAAYPNLGQLTQIQSVKQAVGGCVPNVAIDLKVLCPDLAVYAAGKVGADEEGDFLRKELSRYGIDTRWLSKSQEKTSFTAVMSVTGGQRTFFTYAGACAQYGYDDIDLDAMVKEGIQALHIGYFLLLEKVDNGDGLRILRRAKELGITTSIDLVSENSNRYSLVLPCLPYTDNLIINEAEAGKLTGMEPKTENLRAIAQALKDKGVRQKVIIHMPQISVCLSENGFYALPSYALPKGFIRGTTGAGDAFCAGALLSLLKDDSEMELLEFASCAAVAALSQADAVSGMQEAGAVRALCASFAKQSVDTTNL